MESEISVTPSLSSVVQVNNMESEISATPSLDPNVPRIVITGPSPLNRIPSAASLAQKSEENGIPSGQLVEKSSEATERTVAAPLASEQSSDLSDSTGEFSPAAGCDQCVVPVPEPVIDPVSHVIEVPVADEPIADVFRVNLEDEERSTPDTDIDDLRSNSRCCQGCNGFVRMYYTLAEFTDTEYAIPIWLLLMALPISAGFMGARYLNECKLSPSTPPLMFLMGMSGVIMITARILFIFHRATWEQMVGRTCLYTTIVLTYILTLLIFCTELMTFWRYTPSFEETSPDYCNPTFYKYTFWINCITIIVFILMFIIRIPTCLCAS